MSTPWLDLQKAIYAALTADATLAAKVSTRIFDFVPDNTVYPYIHIGDAEFNDFATQTFDGFSGVLNIHTWARPGTRGRAPVLDIMSDIYRILHENYSMTVTGFDVSNMRYDFSTVLVEDDRVTYHGVTRFKIQIGGNYT